MDGSQSERGDRTPPQAEGPQGTREGGAASSVKRDRFFISYRRSDSSFYADQLYELFTGVFGRGSVFLDRHELPFGTEFPSYLQYEIERSCAALVLIGPTWLSVTDDSVQPARRRLDDPQDFVRMEIESFLDQFIRVVPILVGGTVMPTKDDLPPTIRSLHYRNYSILPATPDIRNCAKLLKGLEEVMNDPYRDDLVRNREDLFVYVSFHKRRNQSEPDWRPYNCRIANRFQQLLDEIWEVGRDVLPEYTYGADWVLRDTETGRVFAHQKMIEGTRGVRVVDGRLLSEVGIMPGAHLIVDRPYPPTDAHDYV